MLGYTPEELAAAREEAKTVHRMRLSIKEAQRLDLCRVCLCDAVPTKEKGNFVLDYGDEFSHRECLRNVWGKT